MPTIREYVNQIRGLDISGSAANAVARAGEFAGQTFGRERIAPAVNRLGDAVADRREQFIVAPEINKGAALFAEYQNEMTKQWNDIAAKSDVNDVTIQNEFREKTFTPTMEKFLNGFQTGEGKKWAESQVANFNQHMLQKTTADMSERAGRAAVLNVDRMKDAQTVRVMNDPSSYNDAIKSVDAAIEANIRNTPNIDARSAAALRTKISGDLKTEITRAYLMGVAQRNPAEAERLINEGKLQHINAVEAKNLLSYAQVQARAQRQDQELQRQQHKRELQERSDIQEGEYMKRLFPEDPKAPITISNSEVVNDPVLDGVAKRRMLQLINRELKPDTDAAVSKYHTNELFARIYAPDDDPNKITDLTPINQAMIDGKLSRTDFNWLRGEVVNNRTVDGSRISDRLKEFYASVTPQIDTSVLGKLDTAGKIKMGEYRAFVRDQLNFARQNKQDVTKLLTPGNPEYLGRPEVLRQFQPSLQQRQQQFIQNMGITPPNPAGYVKPDQSRAPQATVLPVPDWAKKQYPDVKRDDKNRLVIQREVDSPVGKVKKWFVIPDEEPKDQ